MTVTNTSTLSSMAEFDGWKSVRAVMNLLNPELTKFATDGPGG